jgi:hypothetical protein
LHGQKNNKMFCTRSETTRPHTKNQWNEFLYENGIVSQLRNKFHLLCNLTFHICIHRSPSLVLFDELKFSTHTFPTIIQGYFDIPITIFNVSKRSLYIREIWLLQCQIFFSVFLCFGLSTVSVYAGGPILRFSLERCRPSNQPRSWSNLEAKGPSLISCLWLIIQCIVTFDI